ncbi:MAG: hypothetical protein LQ338_006678 [Usnochroma carphineum]|nr:MAG: hypothetical protein LQ338_006678 [Usnochroma carphineum]
MPYAGDSNDASQDGHGARGNRTGDGGSINNLSPDNTNADGNAAMDQAIQPEILGLISPNHLPLDKTGNKPPFRQTIIEILGLEQVRTTQRRGAAKALARLLDSFAIPSTFVTLNLYIEKLVAEQARDSPRGPNRVHHLENAVASYLGLIVDGSDKCWKYTMRVGSCVAVFANDWGLVLLVFQTMLLDIGPSLLKLTIPRLLRRHPSLHLLSQILFRSYAEPSAQAAPSTNAYSTPSPLSLLPELTLYTPAIYTTAVWLDNLVSIFLPPLNLKTTPTRLLRPVQVPQVFPTRQVQVVLPLKSTAANATPDPCVESPSYAQRIHLSPS